MDLKVFVKHLRFIIWAIKFSAKKKIGVALETRTDWKILVFSQEIIDRLLQDVGGPGKYT